MRRFLALLLCLMVLPGTVLRDPPLGFDWQAGLALEPLPLDGPAMPAAPQQALRLVQAWQLRSRHPLFGGYSALIVERQPERAKPMRLLLVSDAGHYLRMDLAEAGLRGFAFGSFPKVTAWNKAGRDAESATRDPATDTVWIGWEGRNAISRHRPDLAFDGFVRPLAMRRWPLNSGAEAMVRLADGRFVVLSEAYDKRWYQVWGEEGQEVRHKALLFAGDPVTKGAPASFTFAGADGYRPTDMAQLPDGRVLVLMRRLIWPFPMRFADCIVVADPRDITAGGTWKGKVVARIASPWPVDNYEGIAVTPRSGGTAGGRLDVWLISDDNGAALQRSLLLRLELDPALLPR